MNGLERRLQSLESRIPPPRSSDAGLAVRGTLDRLAACKQAGRAGEFTEREINLLGGLYAWREMDGVSGEHKLPSGAAIVWIDDGNGTWRVSASGSVAVEDLPDGVRQYVCRLPEIREDRGEGGR